MGDKLQGFECIGNICYYTNIPLGMAGVYVFTNEQKIVNGKEQVVYYVGKAQCLRKRLYQYAEQAYSAAYKKIQQIGDQKNEDPIVWVKYTQDNAVVENELIHSIKPEYNIRVNEGMTAKDGVSI